MSESSHRLSSILLLTFLSSLLLPLCSPRVLSQHKTAVLDVTASIQRAAAAITFNSQQNQALHQTSSKSLFISNSSLISINLHSRDFLPLPAVAASGNHKDYRSLTLARIRRDSSRAKSISARISLAVHGVKKSDLKPLITDDNMLQTTQVSGPVVSGTNQGSGEYFSEVGIGDPAKPAFLVVDTGSDVTWIQCEPCTDCYQQSDPLFDPASSSTYSPLPCDSQYCRSLDASACRNSSCLYQVSYGDGSFTVGEFATETLSFGSSSPVRSIALGCGHDNEGLFIGASGLLGLGGGALSFPSQIKTPSFSYCLVNRDSAAASTLEFGAKNTDATTVSASLLRNRKVDTFYYVGLTGLSVGGETLSIPASAFAMDESGSGGVICDSGTAVTRLQQAAYAALREAFRNGMTDLPAAEEVALFDTCYDLSSRTSVEVPTVGLRFDGGKELKLPATNYLIPVDSAGTFCLAFAPTNSPLSIIGNVQQQGTRVAFDIDNGVVGFTPHKC